MCALRTRHKGDNMNRKVVHQVEIREYSSGPMLSLFEAPGEIPPKNYELIVDEVKTDNALNEVYHISLYTEDDEGSVAEQSLAFHYTNRNKGDVLAAYPRATQFYNPCTMFKEYIDMEGFNKRAISGMKPEIELAMDVPTFLTELSSLPDLFKSGLLKKAFGNRAIKEKLKAALDDPKITKKWSEVVKSKLSKYQGDTWKKELAGDFLNTQFGWLPTVADAKALYSTIVGLEKKLEDLIRKQGIVQRRHYSEESEVCPDDIIFTNDVFADTLKVVFEPCKIRLTATLYYKYRINQLEDLHHKTLLWRAYLDALGFNNPLRTIWERIPLSFVVDWFIPVGDFLEQFSFKWLDTKEEYLDYCLSYRTVTPFTYRISAIRKATGTDIGGCTIFSQHYSRIRAIPNDDKFGVRIDTRYGSKQAVLSAALATVFFGGKSKKSF